MTSTTSGEGIEVTGRHARTCEGSASVTVNPGEVTRVTYRAPIFIFSPGKLTVV
jgi:hypothetical protein